VLRLLGEGVTRTEVARRLRISPHTARTHLQRLLGKLALHSQLEASAYARQLFQAAGGPVTTIDLSAPREYAAATPPRHPASGRPV